MFGPGPTVDKTQILATLDANTHGDSAILRQLVGGPRFSLSNDEIVAAQSTFREIRQLAGDAILAMTTAQAHLRRLYLIVGSSPILERVLSSFADDAKQPVEPSSENSAPTSGEIAPSSAVVTSGEAPTLDELRDRAATHGVQLEDDIILVNGRVYYATSGGPFDGDLSQRQIQMLDLAKRLLAPPRGRSRTAHQFVKLPDKL